MPARGPLLPPAALLAGLGTAAGAATLANCLLLYSLLTKPKNGLSSIMAQLAVADLLVLGAAIWPELWSCNAGTWQFGASCCITYRGLSIFATTASTYLIITVALHTLATTNLHEKETSRRAKISGDEDDEIRSSRHSLVASDSSTPRTISVDYRVAQGVPVSAPTAFVWILAASLSVPEFALTTIIDLGNDFVLCPLIDSNHRMNLYWMLSIFNFLLPIIMVCCAGILIVIKLCAKEKITDDNECKISLQLSLWLILTFCLLCAPRSVLNLYSSLILNENKVLDTEVSPVQQNNILSIMNLVVGGACLLATFVRPMLCIWLLPRLRKVFSSGSRDGLDL